MAVVRRVEARWAACLCAAIACALFVMALPAHAAFPGKNGRIAFTDGNSLFAVNPDGTGASEIPTQLRPVQGISWSADGSMLAFTASSDIAFVSPDGSGYREIHPPRLPQAVSWSPDSSKLVVGGLSLAAPFSFLHTINADGTDPRLLASGAHLAPKWSPNGDRILFTQTEASSAPGLYTMTPDGQDVTMIPGTGRGDQFGDWSPDGQKIVFPRRGNIYSIGVDGSDLAQLTSDGQNGFPVWSPDGSKIAFVSRLTGHGEINTVNADGSGRTQVTNTPRAALAPDWQPLPGPKRSDYKNGAKFCEVERDFLGETDFRQKYGTNGSGANAFGKCVSSR